MPARECSRTACSRPAVSTLTFVYEDSTAVLGPLARMSEPGTYDLCRDHAAGMTAPRGWELLRVPGGPEASDDLVAIADAVRAPDGRGSGTTASDATGDGRAAAGTRPGDRSGPERDPDRSRHLHVIRSDHD